MRLINLFIGVCAGIVLGACSAERASEAEAGGVEVWIDRFEISSRELYSAREEVLEATDLMPGARVADIGAGTGLYTLLFADAVGADGLVYAIEVEPRFLELINQRAEDNDVSNVVSVLGRDSDISLPPASVDIAFISDTYHYFREPGALMASVHRALAPGGRLIVIDFDVDPASPLPSEKTHVRLDKSEVIAEVSSFGFAFAEQKPVEGFSENYMLVFSRPDE